MCLKVYYTVQMSARVSPVLHGFSSGGLKLCLYVFKMCVKLLQDAPVSQVLHGHIARS